MNFHLQPRLENEWVILEPLHKDHYQELYEVAKDPLIWEQHPSNDRYQKEAFATFFQESLESVGALIIREKASKKVIGSSRFKLVKRTEKAVEIGWTFLARNYWGGTYNKAAKKLMIDHALDHFEEVIFYIGEDNIRSQKAVEKIGGERIYPQEFPLLCREDGSDLTYRINKNLWQSINLNLPPK